MHRYLKFGWIENLDTVRHIPLGRFLGVAVSVTPTLWLSPFVFFSLGILQNFSAPNVTPNQLMYLAFVNLCGIEVSTLIHQLGHILGGKLVGSPMDELLLTATRGYNIYWGDQSRTASYVHLGRALGGPILNLVVGHSLAAMLVVVPSGLLYDLLASLASISLLFGYGSFLPLPSVDGWVIWREALRPLRRRVMLG